ncbi:MAG TPA: hypothetical protein VM238_20575 [Phycisphaerae bacterium]|nr:hypothetical protein [Phycisphaerae bacterium]
MCRTSRLRPCSAKASVFAKGFRLRRGFRLRQGYAGQDAGRDGGQASLERGKVPIVIEPVRARITLHRQGKATVYLLDYDGRRTDRRLPVQGWSFAIDGARDKTMYDEMVYE